MAVEIQYWGIQDNEPHTFEGQVLPEDGFARIDGFDDGLGNEAFVCLKDDSVMIFFGHVKRWSSSPEGDDHATIKIVRHLADLGVGERHQEPLRDADDNTRLLLVRNIGSSTINPLLN